MIRLEDEVAITRLQSHALLLLVSVANRVTMFMIPEATSSGDPSPVMAKESQRTPDAISSILSNSRILFRFSNC